MKTLAHRAPHAQAAHLFVTDGGDLRKYFAAIPKIVFELGLNPFQLALYAHFKQTAGDDGGACWKSRATIAKEASMSVGMVTKARRALELCRPELGGKPLITVTEEPSKSGGLPTCRVAVTDIWAENMAEFSTSPHDVEGGATSPHDVATSPHAPCNVTTRPQRKTLEEKLLKKNQGREGNPPPPDNSLNSFSSFSKKRALVETPTPDHFPVTENMRRWATENVPGIDPEFETPKFLDKARDRGRTSADWLSAWRNWMRDALKFAREDARKNSNEKPDERPIWMASAKSGNGLPGVKITTPNELQRMLGPSKRGQQVDEYPCWMHPPKQL